MQAALPAQSGSSRKIFTKIEIGFKLQLCIQNFNVVRMHVCISHNNWNLEKILFIVVRYAYMHAHNIKVKASFVYTIIAV